MDYERQAIPREAIHVNGIGFAPGARKRATVVGGFSGASGFSVVDEGGAIAFKGRLDEAPGLPGLDAPVRHADFSPLAKSGTYSVRVDGNRLESPSFRVAEDVYERSLELAMIGFYGQRCGVAVEFEHEGKRYAKPPCHLGDGLLDYFDPARLGESRDGAGGWHDAGDYGKYAVNAAFATGIMLRAWERFPAPLGRLSLPIPESGGALPDYLAEIKFNLDWILRMQFPDGRVSHKLTRTEFEPMCMPQDDTAQRYYAPWGTDATNCLCAVASQASRVFRPFDPAYADRCLEAAHRAMAFLRSREAPEFPDLGAFKTGMYLRPRDSDREWAAFEYWEATGDETAAREIGWMFSMENYLVDVDWDWSQGKNLGVYAYLASKRDRDPALVEELETDLVAAADRIVANAKAHPFGRGLKRSYWGCNGGIARTALNLQAAHDLTGKDEYLAALEDQLSYLYGNNPYGRSFVTGDGHRPPAFPHHRPSVADGIDEPWPGHLIGGPHPTELDWHDVTEDARTNETAINWDAALVYALAAACPASRR